MSTLPFKRARGQYRDIFLCMETNLKQEHGIFNGAHVLLVAGPGEVSIKVKRNMQNTLT